MKLGEEFSTFTIPISPEVSIYGSQAGQGPPLLLLHGFPQTNLIWHNIASKLTDTYRVVVPDLRGYGHSSKPPGDPEHRNYAKSTLAKDLVTVMDRLSYDKFFVCGHDRGGRVAHAMCVNHPDKVLKVMFLDIVPTLAMFEQMDAVAARTYWHWHFLAQAAPFPETVMLRDPELFAQKYMWSYGVAPGTFHPEAMEAYTDLFRNEAGVHAMCEDYRAGATIDCEEQKEDIEKERKVQCPIRVHWGKRGLLGMKFDPIAEWEKVSSGQAEGEGLDCGHYIPEEKPDEVSQSIREWFVC